MSDDPAVGGSDPDAPRLATQARVGSERSGTLKRDIYRDTSAADDGALDFDDDGAEVVWVDDRADRMTAWDWDHDEWAPEPEVDRIDGLWNRYAGKATARAERIVEAHKMAQAFVDTFATGDKPYQVLFDERVGTAGTDMDARKVIISHKPLFDPTLSVEQARKIITAMACHEADHVRYGLSTARAAKPIIRRDRRAGDLSNILDDHRIERRHVRDYPGHEGIFDSAIEYVARSSLADHPELATGGKLDSTKVKAIGRAGAAIRYDQYTAWTPETSADRDWWRDWAERWSRTDRPKDHVEGLEEGLAYLDKIEEAEQERREQEREQRESQPGQGQGQGQGAQGDEKQDGQEQGASGGQSQDAPESESDLMNRLIRDLAKGDKGDEGEAQEAQLADGFASELGDGIEATARGHGAENAAGPSHDAQNIVNDARDLVEETITNSRGEVFLTPYGISRGRPVPVSPNSAASAAIRAAFARSRTGHFSAERGHRTGRLDNRSLPRIASDDLRLFARRVAPSEGKYLVWLLVDTSGSMVGYPATDATSVAASLAAATRFLPNVTLDVWAWGQARRGWHPSGSAEFSAVRVYHSGDPIASIGHIEKLVRGGTPDAQTLAWAAKAIRAATPRGVEPVILMASDGHGDTGLLNGDFVADLRKRFDVRIYGIAIGSSIVEEFQRNTYGDRGYVPWAGSITATAKPLGDLVARIASGR